MSSFYLILECSEITDQEKEPTNLCAPNESLKNCLPSLIIAQSCYSHYRINKAFACSRCVICVSCSVHLISTYYVRKGSWAFYLIITHKSTRSEILITWIGSGPMFSAIYSSMHHDIAHRNFTAFHRIRRQFPVKLKSHVTKKIP